MSTALARTAPQTIVDHAERERLTRNLILRNATPEQLSLVLGICDRYGFDPLLKHVVIVSNNIYVTRDGLLHIAHASGQFDGIDVSLAQHPDGEWSATCTVYRRDMQRPIRYTAYEREHKPANTGNSAWAKYPRAMLTKCAEVMALRRAFDVSLGAAEEVGYDGQSPDTSLGRVQLVERDEDAPALLAPVPIDATAAKVQAARAMLAEKSDAALIEFVANVRRAERAKIAAAEEYYSRAESDADLAGRHNHLVATGFSGPILRAVLTGAIERLGYDPDDLADELAEDGAADQVPF